jgi:hypothetical protein
LPLAFDYQSKVKRFSLAIRLDTYSKGVDVVPQLINNPFGGKFQFDLTKTSKEYGKSVKRYFAKTGDLFDESLNKRIEFEVPDASKSGISFLEKSSESDALLYFCLQDEVITSVGSVQDNKTVEIRLLWVLFHCKFVVTFA